MSGPPNDDDHDDDGVGHRRPPMRTRRQKGHSTNRGLLYRKRSESAADLITRLLVKPIEITVAGKSKKVPTLEAILLQLWLKEVEGDPRALNIRLKYQQFAQQHSKPRLEVTFVENEYTQILAAKPPAGDDSND